VQEVVGDVHPGQCAGHVLGVPGIPGEHLDLGEPRSITKALGMPRQHPHPMASGQEQRHKAATDISGASGDQAGTHEPILSPLGTSRMAAE